MLVRASVVGLVTTLVSGVGTARAEWEEPARIARGDVLHVDSATMPDGRHVTVWMVDAPLGAPDPLLLEVGSAAPLKVTADGEGSVHFSAPSVVVDPTGRVTVVWVGESGRRHSVRARTWSPGSGLGEQVVLSGEARSSRDNPAPFDDPRVQVDGDGNVVTAWLQEDGSQAAVLATRTLLADGTVGKRQVLSADANHVEQAALLTGTGGRVEVVYSTNWSQAYYKDAQLVLRVQDVAGHFDGPEPLGGGNVSAVDTDADGRLVLSWFSAEKDALGVPLTHWVRVREADGTWLPDRLVGTSDGWKLLLVDEVLLADDGRIHLLATGTDYDDRSLVTLHPDGRRTLLSRVVNQVRPGYSDGFPMHTRTRMTVDAVGRLLLAWPGRAGLTVVTVTAAADKVAAQSVLDRLMKYSDDKYELQTLDVTTDLDGAVRVVGGTWVEGGRGRVFEQTWR